MATITKRKNGRWQAKVRRYGLPALSRTFDRKKDAETWALQEESDFNRGAWHDRRTADNVTFHQLLDDYLTVVVPTKRSADAEVLRVRTMQRDPMSRYRLSAITPAVLADWRDGRLAGGARGSTINRELNFISAVFNWARKERMFQIENPVSAIRRPPSGPARERRLERDEEKRLMDALESHPAPTTGAKRSGQYRVGSRNAWLKPLVQLALETGMRRGELLALHWENVDLKAHTAFLEITKNGDSRTVPLSKKAVSILRTIGKSEKGAVFPTSPEAVKKAWKRACAQAKIADLHFHDLRHEAASRLAEKLPNLIELGAVTGHRDLRSLKRYYHPRTADLVRKLG